LACHPVSSLHRELNKTVMIKTTEHQNILLTGMIVFANLDYAGWLDYGVKAIIGGCIWMGFKLAADYISEKIKSK
jgi:hypothetical protein